MAVSPHLRSAASHLLLALLLLAPPVVGTLIAGESLGGLLTFPPDPRLAEESAFSWPVALMLAGVTLMVVAGALWMAWAEPLEDNADAFMPARLPMPRWGVGAVAALLLAWGLGWFMPAEWAPWHALTFAPLWIAYAVVMNALTLRRTGHCLLLDRPGFFLALFPLSTLLWWYFELLNNVVHNWYYVGVEGWSPGIQALHASVAFSTVLPAVLSTRHWLAAHPWLVNRLNRGRAITPRSDELPVVASLTLGVAALAALAVWPRALFPLVWLAPLLVLSGWRVLLGHQSVFHDLRRGDWSRVLLAALAGLLCGFLWELWNWGNPVHWSYTVPYVSRFHLFEMPLLGYAGYLPFGILCVATADLIVRPWRRRPRFKPVVRNDFPVKISVELK